MPKSCRPFNQRYDDGNKLIVYHISYLFTTKKPLWFHVFPLSQLKVRDYVTIRYTVGWLIDLTNLSNVSC